MKGSPIFIHLTLCSCTSSSRFRRFLGFFIFILFSSFFIINLVVAVICESLIQISRGPPNLSGDPSTTTLKADNADDDVSPVGLEVMMRQMLTNQSEMAATIRELQQEVATLREGIIKQHFGLPTLQGPPRPPPRFPSPPVKLEEDDDMPMEYTAKLRDS